MTFDLKLESTGKIRDIRTACSDQDIERLTRLAASTGGLLSDELRHIAWPLLLGSRRGSGKQGETRHSKLPSRTQDWRSLPAHKDEEQVRLDVNRAFVHYPDVVSRPRDEEKNHVESETEAAKDHLKALLNDLIISTLRHHPCLNYFQGYHDIAQVLLLVYHSSDSTNTVTLASDPLARLSLLRIRDFMLPTITGTTSHLDLLAPLLHAADRPLFDALMSSNLHTQPFFALSSTLTMYAHDIQSYTSIARIFDFLLASEAVMPVYMYASVILLRKADLLCANDDGDPAVLYAILSHLPQDLDIEGLIAQTRDLYTRIPPYTLGAAWRCMSVYSVLKTTRSIEGLGDQSLATGEEWMKLHAEELTRLERRRVEEKQLRELLARYAGRVSTGVVIAILVGGIAAYLSRQGGMENAARTAMLTCSRLGDWGRNVIAGLVALARSN